MILPVYLEFAEFSERNFGLVKKPIDFWLRKGRLSGRQSRPRTDSAKAESEVTTNLVKKSCYACINKSFFPVYLEFATFSERSFEVGGFAGRCPRSYNILFQICKLFSKKIGNNIPVDPKIIGIYT